MGSMGWVQIITIFFIFQFAGRNLINLTERRANDIWLFYACQQMSDDNVSFSYRKKVHSLDIEKKLTTFHTITAN